MSATLDQLLQQAVQARREHRLADAKHHLVEAVTVGRNSGTRAELAKALAALGQIDRDLDHGDVARHHYEEALALYRAEDDALRIAHTVRHLGDIHRHQGRPELAEPCYHEALVLYRSHGETPPLDLANAIRGLAVLKTDAGETQAARVLWEEARSLYSAVNVEAGVEESTRRLALLGTTS